MPKNTTIDINAIILHHLKMTLKSPFVTSMGTLNEKEFFVVEVQDKDGLSGWGETAAFSYPWYTEETIKTNLHVLEDYLIPLILKAPLEHPTDVARRFSPVQGHPMAKAALEGAIWDLYAKRVNQPLYRLIDGRKDKIEVGISLGIPDSLSQLLHMIDKHMEQGYKRVKIKIEPGWDVEVVHEIRSHFPDLPLMVDANGVYRLEDADHLKKLDHYHLLMIEQPLSQGDLVEHAQLQRYLETPICLDESIVTIHDVKQAIALGSCQVINLKVSRVGGLTMAQEIHHLCRREDISLWCGGMLEAGIGRAHNIAVASLDQFHFPGDISASNRYWDQDIIDPEVVVTDGFITVPERAGLGYDVDRKQMARYTQFVKVYRK